MIRAARNRPLPAVPDHALGGLNRAARSHSGTIAEQRFELRQAFAAEVENRCGKPASACTVAEINAVRDALGRDWWDERAPQPHVDFTEPLKFVEFTTAGPRVATPAQERLPF